MSSDRRWLRELEEPLVANATASPPDVLYATSGDITSSGLTCDDNSLLGRDDTGGGPGPVTHISIGSGLTLTGGELSATAGGAGSIGVAVIACNTGETFFRETIAEPAIISAADQVSILCIRRPAALDTDETYMYVANVVDVATGQFTVELAAMDEDGQDVIDVPPNENIKLVYQVTNI